MSALVLLVEIAGRRVALPSACISSVIELEQVVPVPASAPCVVGLTALRSMALAVIDCRLVLGAGEETGTTDSRAVIVRDGGDQYALMVDAVLDVAQQLSKPAAIGGGFGERWKTVALGTVETSEGPALLTDPNRLIGQAAGVPIKQIVTPAA